LRDFHPERAVVGSSRAPGTASGARPPLTAAGGLFLLAAICLALVAVLAPLGTFFLFGSDTGEYYRLTETLLAQGRLPVGVSYSGGYAGWGFAYPDFPGLFVLAGAGAQALGISAFTALLVLVPVVAALSVLPLFLLFRRLFPSDAVAVLAAGMASVLMPRLFSIAHPAPLALGDLLAVGGLWLFVEGRTDARWYGPLALVGGALIVTHHLSSYFFLVSALGGLVLLELWRPGGWSRRFPLRELVFLGAFAVAMLVFWFDYATDFHGVLEQGGIPGALTRTPLPFALAAVGVLVLVGAVVRWRRRAPFRPRVRAPTDGALLRDAIIVGGLISGGLALLLVIPLPATSQELVPGTLLWFSPFILFAAFTSGVRRTLTLAPLGPFGLTWLVALGGSAIFALATNNPVLLPSRHAEYLVIPLALFAAPTLVYLALRLEALAGRRGLLAAGLGVAVLLGANAAIAFPPPAVFGGFQEGLTAQDAALWMWAGGALPPTTVAASDHRLSSMLFGFDGFAATWQDTPGLFVGSNWTEAELELARSPAPHDPYVYPIRIVAVDPVMHAGVALDPSQPARPLSASATCWFGQAPFVPIYENGGAVVYWVDDPYGPAPSCT
jgi:hypothetical protein